MIPATFRGFNLEVDTIHDAWFGLINTVFGVDDLCRPNSDIVVDERGDTIHEIVGSSIDISCPTRRMIPDVKILGCGIWTDVSKLEEYSNKLLLGINDGFEYSYGGRSRHYGSDRESDVTVDQTISAVHRLQDNINTRRSVICLPDPMVDIVRENIPCIEMIQFLHRFGDLNLIAFMRSWDIASASSINLYGLTRLLQYVAHTYDYDNPLVPGHVKVFFGSGHVRDSDVWWCKEAIAR